MRDTLPSTLDDATKRPGVVRCPVRCARTVNWDIFMPVYGLSVDIVKVVLEGTVDGHRPADAGGSDTIDESRSEGESNVETAEDGQIVDTS